MALIEMAGHNRSIIVNCCSKATFFDNMTGQLIFKTK
jgi:hypothetical protein